MVAGMASGPLPVVSWEALGADPELARGFDHVVAFDPPPVAAGLALLDGCGAATHLAWGQAERDFTLASWRDRLDLRPALIEIWRLLDARGELTGAELATALQGGGQHPRDGRHCGRLVRILCELDLATWDLSAAGPRLARGSVRKTDLQTSHANRAYTGRLAAAERYLTAPQQGETRAAV